MSIQQSETARGSEIYPVQESLAQFWQQPLQLSGLCQSKEVAFGAGLACVAGVRKGRGRELGRETTRPIRSRAPKFPLPLPLLMPATQARAGQGRCPLMGSHFFQYNDYVTSLKSRKETGCNHAFFKDKCVSSGTCWLVRGSLSNATKTKMAGIKTKTNNPARASHCLIRYIFFVTVFLRTWKIHQHLTNWTTWNKRHKFSPLAVVVLVVFVALEKEYTN